MATSYTRVSDINERVNDMSLTMTQWRVLFSINTDTVMDTIKSYLSETDEAEITAAIDSLKSMGLVEGGADAAPAAETPKPEAAPEPIPDPVAEELTPEPETEVAVEEEIIADIVEDDSTELDDIVSEIEEEEVQVDDIVEAVEEAEPEVEVAVEEEAEAAPEPEPVVEEPAAAAAPSGDSKTVVVADDSIVIRKMVELALENEAFTVIGYSTGQEVIDNFDSDAASLLILDLNLPDINGVEIMKKAKSKSNIPCLMFAGKNAGIDEDKLKGDGVDDFVAKPFRDEDLIAKVKELAK